MASGAHVGVKGCGEGAVYVFTNQAGWVANTGAVVAKPTQ